MKKIFPLLILLIAAASTAFPQSGRRITTPAASTPPPPIQPPLNPEPEIRSAPPLTEMLSLPESVRERRIKSLENSSFRLADFQGKVVVINLWASWCGPCRREVPEYEKVRKAYLNSDVVFIGLTTEDPRVATDRVKSFVRDVGFGFILGWADRELASTLMNGGGGIPQTLVIDADGRVISHWRGYTPNRSGEQLKHTIEQALKRE